MFAFVNGTDEAKWHSPHVHLSSENPKATMRYHPLVRSYVEAPLSEGGLGMNRMELCYCLFGENIKKLTNLWHTSSNVFEYFVDRRGRFKRVCDAVKSSGLKPTAPSQTMAQPTVLSHRSAMGLARKPLGKATPMSGPRQATPRQTPGGLRSTRISLRERSPSNWRVRS